MQLVIARELEQDCKRCKGSGVVLVGKKQTTTLLVCSCHAARHLAAQVSPSPRWADGERRG